MSPYGFDSDFDREAVGEYTRSLMYHRFTGMPKRDFVPRILPRPATDLADTGALFYEVVEERLSREDFERRLAHRQVSQWEWRNHEHWRRRVARDNTSQPPPALTYQEKQRCFCEIMGQIVRQALDMAARIR